MEILTAVDQKILSKGKVILDFDRKRIKLLGGITDKTAKKFIKYLKELELSGASSIDILIMSQGGNGFAANKIGGSIQRSKAQIRGINIGFTYSAALDILEYCHLRVSLPKGKFRMHKNSYHDGRYSDKKIPIEPDESCKILAKFIIEWFAYRTGKSEEVIKKWHEDEKFWTAEEALKDKLIDEILYDYRI